MDDVVEIPLTRGYVALVDAADAPLVLKHKWSVAIRGKRRYAMWSGFLMHRFLIDAGDLDVDHRNHNGLDNRRSNLVVRDRSKNMQNWASGRKRSKYGYWGVSLPSGHQSFVAYVNKSGERIKRYGYTSIEEAARARDELLVRLRPDTWHRGQLNFPDEMTPERVHELTKNTS